MIGDELARSPGAPDPAVVLHDPTCCALCPGCATRLAVLEGMVAGSAALASQLAGVVQGVADDLGRMRPMLDLLDQLGGSEPVSPLKLLGLLRGGGS